MEDEKELILKLAKAKAFYINLCEMIDIRASILTGRIRGSKNDWNSIKDTIDRGKIFFDEVKGIECQSHFPHFIDTFVCQQAHLTVCGAISMGICDHPESDPEFSGRYRVLTDTFCITSANRNYFSRFLHQFLLLLFSLAHAQSSRHRSPYRPHKKPLPVRE